METERPPSPSASLRRTSVRLLESRSIPKWFARFLQEPSAADEPLVEPATPIIQTTEHVVPATPIVQATERVVIPIQRPIQTGASARDRVTGGFTPPPTSAFAALKTTTIQQALGHPLAYVRVLMQLGYEPLPPFRGKSLFGKEALYYPNVLRYRT